MTCDKVDYRDLDSVSEAMHSLRDLPSPSTATTSPWEAGDALRITQDATPQIHNGGTVGRFVLTDAP